MFFFCIFLSFLFSHFGVRFECSEHLVGDGALLPQKSDGGQKRKNETLVNTTEENNTPVIDGQSKFSK